MKKKLLAVEETKEVNETTAVKERELVIYAKVGNEDGLKEADVIEKHVQLDARFVTGHRCRVRRITKPEETKYVYTFKIKDENEEINSSVEYNVDVDKDFFEGFSKVADCKYNKTRYIFSSKTIKVYIGTGEDKEILEIPNIQYEVDVFESDEGNKYKWIKIDIEVDVILDYIETNLPDIKDIKLNISISHLPFKPTDMILDFNESHEDEEFIESLWDKWKIELNPEDNDNDEDNDDDDEEGSVDGEEES